MALAVRFWACGCSSPVNGLRTTREPSREEGPDQREEKLQPSAQTNPRLAEAVIQKVVGKIAETLERGVKCARAPQCCVRVRMAVGPEVCGLGQRDCSHDTG